MSISVRASGKSRRLFVRNLSAPATTGGHQPQRRPSRSVAVILDGPHQLIGSLGGDAAQSQQLLRSGRQQVTDLTTLTYCPLHQIAAVDR
jgi:hypothetical protein